MGLIEDLHTTETPRQARMRMTNRRPRRCTQTLFRSAIFAAAVSCAPVHAACNFDVLKQGHVAAIIDARTFRLADGQQVRLAGIELLGATTAGSPPDRTALTQLLLDHEVTLRGPNPKPDRYGRLVALVFADEAANSIQGRLLEQGAAAFSGDFFDTDNKDCTAELLANEAAARRARRGIWADASAIKNTESADDILPWIGQFVVAEGKIASVREAGGTVYVYFGRRWSEGFAVTISRRMVRRFDAAGIALKILENRIVRVRGFVERRGGPRIEAISPGQIEVVGANR
jgi:endonuclease YncB( thermonuclease family)